MQYQSPILLDLVSICRLRFCVYICDMCVVVMCIVVYFVSNVMLLVIIRYHNYTIIFLFLSSSLHQPSLHNPPFTIHEHITNIAYNILSNIALTITFTITFSRYNISFSIALNITINNKLNIPLNISIYIPFTCFLIDFSRPLSPSPRCHEYCTLSSLLNCNNNNIYNKNEQ